MDARADIRLTVAHSLFEWLPLTMTWVYGQVTRTPVDALVLADAVSNLDAFPWQPLVVPGAAWRGHAARAARKLGVAYAPAPYGRALRAAGAAVLHSHYGHRGWVDLPLARRAGLKHVVTFYGSDVSRLPRQRPEWRARYLDLFRRADLFLCEGPYMAASVVALGAPEGRVAVQRLGVDLRGISFRPRSPADDGVVRVLIAGTFRQKKGIPAALEAAANVSDRGRRLHVTVIGNATAVPGDQAEKRAIMEVVKRRRLADRVTFLGLVSHDALWAEAARNHIFLSPSRVADDGDTEGGAPVTIIEMAAGGMPVVSTRHCDIPEVVVDGETGRLAPEGDMEALTEALDEVVAHPESWPRLGQAARRHVEDRFDVDRLCAGLAERYAALRAR